MYTFTSLSDFYIILAVYKMRLTEMSLIISIHISKISINET